MKKEKGMSLIVLTLIIVTIVIIGSVAIFIVTKGNKTNSNAESSSETSGIKEDTNTEQAAQGQKFWVDNHKNWGEQKENLNLKLFDGKFTAPIDLRIADNFIKQVSYYPDGLGKTKKANNINEVLNLETLIRSDASIWLDYGEFFEEYGSYNDSIKLTLENFYESETSIKECFDNNWWCITTSSIQDGLGITTDDKEYNSSWDSCPLLDKVISILGGPKHIYTYLKSDGEYKNITYGLYYEYSEFSMQIYVMELYAGKNYRCEVSEVRYGPNEYWKEEIKNRQKSYSDFEIMK